MKSGVERIEVAIGPLVDDVISDSIGTVPDDAVARIVDRLDARLTDLYPSAAVTVRTVNDWRDDGARLEYRNADGTLTVYDSRELSVERPCPTCGKHGYTPSPLAEVETETEGAIQTVCAAYVAEDEAEGAVWTVRDSATGDDLAGGKLMARLDAMALADDLGWATFPRAVAVRAAETIGGFPSV